MKKMVYVMSAILPMALLANIASADAQRRNDTKKDVQAPMVEMQKTTPEQKEMIKKDMSKKEMNKDMKKKCKMDKTAWLDKQNREINEDYNEAVEKINKSSFSAGNKTILMNQAKENKDLAMKQAREKVEMRAKHWESRKMMKSEIKAEKTNRKAVKEVDDID